MNVDEKNQNSTKLTWILSIYQRFFRRKNILYNLVLTDFSGFDRFFWAVLIYRAIHRVTLGRVRLLELNG